MRVHAALTIKVVYDDAESVQTVKHHLQEMAHYIADDGYLTGDDPMVVDTWSLKVEAEEEY
jgi:hypothetical protein